MENFDWTNEHIRITGVRIKLGLLYISYKVTFVLQNPNSKIHRRVAFKVSKLSGDLASSASCKQIEVKIHK